MKWALKFDNIWILSKTYRFICYLEYIYSKFKSINHCKFELFSFMIMAVILSVPIPSSVLTAQIYSRMDSTTGQIFESFGVNSFIFSLISLQHYSLDKQSQIPSHATIMYSSLRLLGIHIISGKAVTAYYSGVLFLWSLYW